MPEPTRELQQYCRNTIETGSLSFAMASKVFGRREQLAAHCIYAWCRYCDDQIDKIDLTDLPEDEKRKLQAKRLELLNQKTRFALKGEPQTELVFRAFQYAFLEYQIPGHYPLELLQGMAMDIRRHRYQTIEDLELYCYRVASVVGLMMVHVMGVSNERALSHAADMGMAMQMTNIARDVMEDASMGRVYFPDTWLDEVGIKRCEINSPAHRPKVAQLVQKLLTEAQSRYRSGNYGLKFLPLRAGFAISAASSIYSEIGKQVLRRSEKAWDTRTVVTKRRKLVLLVGSLFRVIKLVPKRIFRPWSAAPIRAVWRFS